MVDNPSQDRFRKSDQANRNRNRAINYDGGEAYEYNQSENQGNQNAASSRQAAKPARKAQTKKIQRYESNSIDEEEFQDYFTNPIKRKEFDRQRKKQQMREMQNITGFTLGQFGIKSMKAMKEAMPAYPDDDDLPATADQQKNYATVSLCCLSVTNPFRNKIIQLVAVNPWFDRFILFVIMVNCFFLALDKEVDSITKNNATIDFIFLVIYTMEMILKIIAMGFFMRAHSYLRDSWNILDFMVVMLGWLSQALNSGDISAIKVIRILRPLRTINQIPNMSSLVSTILNSLPIMFDVMVLFFFMLIMFGTIATQLLGGHLEKRCVAHHIPQEEGDEMIITLGIDQQEYICQKVEDCWDADIPGVSQENKQLMTCDKYGNPFVGTYGFDNILLSIMNIFQIITLEGWTDMMYIVRDAERSYMFDLFFVSCVVFGSFVILNLMIAVQASYLDSAFDEEDNRQRELQEKIELKKRMKQELEEQEEYDEEEEQFEEDQDDRSPPGENGRRRSSKRKGKEEDKGCCAHYEKPKWFVELSLKCESICESGEFERLIIVLILINTLFLASEHYGPPNWLVKLSDIANLFFTVVFLVEMLMKLIGFGCKKYLQDNFNIFDAFIVTMSYVELLMPGDASSLSVLRAFRLLRIFKIIKSWESLRILLSTVLDSLTAITNLGVLIILYLFISALLTKQFYSEPLLDSDGNESRYNFGSTTQALVTVFIILTGENWNEIMIQVIDQQKSFAPATFFILLMIIGNFMLLNLFLAILLKSISEIGNADDEEEDPTKAEQSNPEGDGANDHDHENDPENDSVPLNSSNSNIEEEFEQIKLQLMALSNNMNAMLDGSIKNAADGNDDVLDSNQSMSLDSEARQEREDRKKQKKVQAQQQAKMNKFSQSQQIAEQKEEHQQGYSLFIFSPTNPIRIFLRDFVSNSYFAGFIYHMIALNSLLLALDEPKLSDPYQEKTISNLLLIISIIFVVEMVVKIIVVGFYWGERTYLKDNWNILDFIIVMFSILTWIMEAAAGADISFIRGFRALRALRPLRVVSKNEGIKTVVNSLLLSIPALLNVLLIVLLFLMVFGILGIQLFMGKLGDCNDRDLPDGSQVEYRTQCLGWFTVDIYNGNGEVIGFERQKREWVIPINNYDDIFHSMMTFFEISTLEMWPGMMYGAIDTVGIDMVPVVGNSEWVSILFIVFIFFTTFFIMNLFISVIVDKFNEEIKKRQGSDNFTDEQKEWVKIQRLLVHTNPKIIPVEPINCFRLQCFKIVQSQAFEYVVMTAIVINTFFLCIDYHGKSDELAQLLDRSNLSFVVFFTIEMTLKITAYGFKYYWYVNWNKFDFIIVMMSLVSLNENLLERLHFNPTALRIIRVSRLLRMVKTSEGLRTLLKTLFMSLGNILNTAALLMLIFFTFSVAGMSLFGKVPDGEFIGKNVSFTSFYLAMMTLWRASTGESWNGIMHDCFESQGIVAVFFWLSFQLIAFFIFMNVFIAVIGESFNDNQATEDENDILALKKKDIKAFQNTWAKYNPMGELYMRTIRLPDFLRELPPPLGYQGIRIEESKLNKIIFCLNIRDHLGRVYYPEVMWTIFHSIAGMNDDKVLNCEQIINILKLVKSKYKGLGKKVNLDSLCGNKYYRKELTAIKYIQAMKILTKWRNFKVIKAKNKDQMGINGFAAEDNDNNHDNRPKPSTENKLFQESNNDNPRLNQNYGQGNHPEISDQLEPYENNSGSYGTENQARLKQTRLQNINKAIDRNRENERSRGGNSQNRSARGRAQQYVQEDSYGEEEQPGPRSGNRGARPEDSFEEMDNESADQDMPVTERNPMSGREKQRDKRLQRDDMSDPYQSSKQIRGRR